MQFTFLIFGADSLFILFFDAGCFFALSKFHIQCKLFSCANFARLLVREVNPKRSLKGQTANASCPDAAAGFIFIHFFVTTRPLAVFANKREKRLVQPQCAREKERDMACV
jgi:hypothetical protein